MAHEYRYPLTRVCLRGGNMTLPRTMIGLFPDDGAVTMVDSLTGAEHEAYMSGPRVVSGLGELYREHGLDVNDELIVSRLSDARFSITPVVRAELEAEAEAAAAAEGAGAEEPGAEDAGAHTDAAGGHAAGSQAADIGAAQEGAEPLAVAESETGAAEAAPEGAVRDDADAPEGAYDRYMREAAAQEADAAAEPAAGHHERTSLDPRLAVREAESALSELESGGTRAERAGSERKGSAGAGSVETSSEPSGSLY